LWGKAGQRSLARSALPEATAQLTRALAHIEALPVTAAASGEQIKLQVALANALMHTKGWAAPETKASIDRARLLIDAEALDEPPEDPLLLFSVLYGFWGASFGAFNGDVVRELAAQFLALAESQGAKVPLMIGHRLMGTSLMCTGDIAEGRAHYDQAIALYDPGAHRLLATRFGVDAAVSVLSWRPLALWLLGYPGAALADTEQALKNAREIANAATLMFALAYTLFTPTHCGNFAAASAQADELVALADEKGALLWKAHGMMHQGCILALAGKASKAVQTITSGITAYRSQGSTAWVPWYLSHLARAYAELSQPDNAWRSDDGH
jgi:tetratricopeptide (TPR) repeat protein